MTEIFGATFIQNPGSSHPFLKNLKFSKLLKNKNNDNKQTDNKHQQHEIIECAYVQYAHFYVLGTDTLHNSYQHKKKNLISLSLVPENTYRNKRFCIVKKVIFVQICKSWRLHDRVLDNSSVHATRNYVFRTLKTHKKPNKII